MKTKLLLFIAILFATITVTNAQTDKPRMKFMGISLDMPYNKFHKELKKQKYYRSAFGLGTIREPEGATYIYSGVFGGYNATLFVDTTPDASGIASVIVRFVGDDTLLKQVQEEFKKPLKDKYGDCLQSNKVNVWELDSGDIILGEVSYNQNHTSIYDQFIFILSYNDKINYAIREAEAARVKAKQIKNNSVDF